MTRILLLRHGESEWNATGRWQGWADIDLTSTGRLQAATGAERLRSLGITKVAASDLRRTTDTANIISTALGLGPVTLEPGLREFDVGEWSGLTRPEIEARWPGQLDSWSKGKLDRTPGGESRRTFTSRILTTLTALGAAHTGDTLLGVTHGGFIGALQRALHPDGDRDRIANLTGRWVDVDDGQVALGPIEPLLGPGETTEPASL